MSAINLNTIKHGAVRAAIRMLLMIDNDLGKVRGEREELKKAYEDVCAKNARLHDGLAKAEALCKQAPSSYVELEQQLKAAENEANNYRVAYNNCHSLCRSHEARLANQAETIRGLNDQLHSAHMSNAELDKSLTALNQQLSQKSRTPKSHSYAVYRTNAKGNVIENMNVLSVCQNSDSNTAIFVQ